MSAEFTFVVIVVAVALAFDFVNGFHDTANAIASPIATEALAPRPAIILAAVMNLLGALAFTGVAKTVGGKIINPFALENGIWIVLAALIAALGWNLLTWYFGLPSSSSHALVGGLVGAAVASAGSSVIEIAGLTTIIAALIISPLLAGLVGYIISVLVSIISSGSDPRKVNRVFRRLQAATAAAQAFSHGTNDAQKTMGVITMALIAGGFQDSLEIALWVKLAAAGAMGLGTYAGGWRIIRTVGKRIFPLRPPTGFSADIGSAFTILGASLAGLPVSTTHVVSSSIVGVGLAAGPSSVRWSTATKILTAWVLTLPLTAGMAAVIVQIFMAVSP